MSLNTQAQLKISYPDYQMHQVKQICSTLSPKRLILLSEQIQSRIIMLGQNPANSEVYNYVMEKVNKGATEYLFPGEQYEK